MPKLSGESPARGGAMVREAIWVGSNLEKESARALEMLHVQLISAVIDPYSWKWVLIALHHALQAFVTASLAGDRRPGEPQAGASGEWMAACEATWAGVAADAPDPLPDAFARAKAQFRYEPTAEIDQDLARVFAYRDLLVRRLPESWMLRVNDLPRVTRNGLAVIEHFGWNPGHMVWRRQPLADLARVKHQASIKVLEALQTQYQL